MSRKLQFYDEYGVEEYYIYDPDRGRLNGWQRVGDSLSPIEEMRGWRSPRLGIRFDMEGKELSLYYPDGRPFLSFLELNHARVAAEARAKKAEAQIAVETQARATAEARNRELEAKLKEAGLL
jgi:hypothetical protein